MKTQFESSTKVHQNILHNNASTMEEMETTISNLKNQLQIALNANNKVIIPNTLPRKKSEPSIMYFYLFSSPTMNHLIELVSFDVTRVG